MPHQNLGTSSGLTLKVFRVPFDGTEWMWRLVTDHNGEAISQSDRRFASEQEAKNDGLQAWQVVRTTNDADLERLEHEQSTAAGAWSGDRGAELERLERSEQTHSERSLDELPERGIEDDEEELER